ncbi:MAG: TetR family transcriptional regulator [Candidatus Lokiarchaeota archaeon]|nr:TetR family transcriptional regulator [Candidatus Lokiarchaeota archaeon]MBD3339907.1 TetR family transcriptional regulator [Candidatus Lokiarchaeota archaeon]
MNLLNDESKLSTKEKIYHAALNLFSKKGFDGVSMRNIAKDVGIRVGSIYNHFDEKRDIFEYIFDKIEDYYKELTPSQDVIIEMFTNPTMDTLQDLTIQAIKFYLGEPWIIKTWKIVFIERFNHPRARSLFIENILEGGIKFQVPLFNKLLKDELNDKIDIEALARAFHGHNIFLILRYMDELSDEGTNQRILKEIQKEGLAHVNNFSVFFKKTID